MVNLISDDVNMGTASDITFEPGRFPRIGGLWMIGFSVDRAQAYGEHPATKGSAIAYWSLSVAQLALLLALAPERRLMNEADEEPFELLPTMTKRAAELAASGQSFAEAGARLSQLSGHLINPAEAAAILAAAQPALEPSRGAGAAATKAVLIAFQIAWGRRSALATTQPPPPAPVAEALYSYSFQMGGGGWASARGEQPWAETCELAAPYAVVKVKRGDVVVWTGPGDSMPAEPPAG